MIDQRNRLRRLTAVLSAHLQGHRRLQHSRAVRLHRQAHSLASINLRSRFAEYVEEHAAFLRVRDRAAIEIADAGRLVSRLLAL